MSRKVTLGVIGVVLVAVAVGFAPSFEDGTWNIVLRNDTPRAVVVKACANDPCDRFRYVKAISAERAVRATDHGDGRSWWTVMSQGRTIGCLTLNYTDRVGGYMLRVSRVISCPFRREPAEPTQRQLAEAWAMKHFHKLWETRRPPRAGIVEASPPGPSEYLLLGGSHVYRRWAAGRLTLVYSGALTQKRSQGVVYVVDYAYPLRVSLVPDPREVTEPDDSRAGVYLTPIQVGGVWIAGYHGNVLTLLSTDRHHRMTFNLRTRRFRVADKSGYTATTRTDASGNVTRMTDRPPIPTAV